MLRLIGFVTVIWLLFNFGIIQILAMWAAGALIWVASL